MSVLEFIASLVKSIAWPAFIFATALVFRKQLVEVIGKRLHRMKASPGGLELEFFDEQVKAITNEVRDIEERQLAQLAAESTAAPSLDDADESASGALTADSQLVHRLLDVSPSAAALEAYAQLEDRLRSLLVQYGIVEPRQARQSMRFLSGLALKSGVVDPNMAGTLRELTALRNLLVHRGLPDERSHFDRRRAVDFINLTSELQEVLHRIPPGRAYEAAVEAALHRIGMAVTRSSTSKDQGWDFLVGSERRVAVEAKYSSRPFSTQIVDKLLGISAERPIVLVVNSDLSAAAQERLLEAQRTGHSIRLVRWQGADDDPALSDTISRSLEELEGTR